MLKISLIAAASMVALGSVSAAEQLARKQKDRNDSVTAQAEPQAGDGDRIAIIASGSERSNVAGTAVAQPAMRAPALMTVTPFVSYAMSGNAVNDAELQKQIQDIRSGSKG